MSSENSLQFYSFVIVLSIYMTAVLKTTNNEFLHEFLKLFPFSLYPQASN